MSIEAMEMALEALHEAIAFREGGLRKAIKAVDALRIEIAQAKAQSLMEAIKALGATTSELGRIEKAISSGYFGVLPVRATIPMCKAGWDASGGKLTLQEIGHIYEEMYKARPSLDNLS